MKEIETPEALILLSLLLSFFILLCVLCASVVPFLYFFAFTILPITLEFGRWAPGTEGEAGT
jgi:hypothetical protein